MMPPHIRKTVPADGEELTGDTVEFHGYSLGIVGPEALVEVVNGESGDGVEFEAELDCEWIGPGGGPPGSRQQFCILSVRLVGPRPGRYRLTVLKTSIEVTVAT